MGDLSKPKSLALMSVIAGLTAINQTPLGEHKPGSNNKANKKLKSKRKASRKRK